MKNSVLCIYLFCILLRSVLSDANEVDRLFLTNVVHDGGYVYLPPPLPPVQLDEPPDLPPIYLPPPQPPIFADEIPFAPTPTSPAYLPPAHGDVLPPQLPPANDDSISIPAQPPSGLYQPPTQSLLPPHFRIENMSCIQGVNFKATFKLPQGSPSQFPVVDDAMEGCIMPMNGGNTFKIDLDSFNSMLKCGVKRCREAGKGKGEGGRGVDNMCVQVRIPTVRGVRLPEDGMVTLMCTPQERVVSQTRHVKLGTNQILPTARARSNNAFVATGGTQKELKSRIGIFRKRPGSPVFDQNVQPDSVIQLGEELILRAAVTDGDGWRGTQIGPVLITGLNSKKSVLLVNQQGCVNPGMKSICPRQPVKLNPLTTELHFRAFLFQESPQGDDMVVSVRTQGCLHSQDCTKVCTEDPERSRIKRAVPKNISQLANVENVEMELHFKVQPRIVNNNPPKNNNFYLRIVYISLVCMTLSVLVIIVLLWHIFCRNKK